MTVQGRRRTMLSFLIVGAGLAVLGGTNVWIGADKAGDYVDTIARIKNRIESGSDEASPRDLENARGKHSFYLGVEEAGWWLTAAGLALGCVGLGVALAEVRARGSVA